MRIGGRAIGGEAPAYVIAEIGVNHDGAPERAVELVEAAAEAGADAVKFQLFRADLLMSRTSKLAAYQQAAGESDPVEMLRRLELGVDELAPAVAAAKRRGVHAIVTVFSVELVAEAERLAWDAYKTASPDVVHRPLLEALAATGRPLIVSTGASTLEEVRRAVAWLDVARDRLAVLQCVSSYPTPVEGAELGGIGALVDAVGGAGVPVGYSDHTPDELTGGMAVRLGASILEKHMTYSCAARGPDHAASLEPGAMARYCGLAHATRPEPWPAEIERAKRVTERELDVRRVSRQSIVTRRALRAGERLSREDVTFKRPGTGIEPFCLGEVLGRTIARPVEADTPITAADLGG